MKFFQGIVSLAVLLALTTRVSWVYADSTAHENHAEVKNTPSYASALADYQASRIKEAMRGLRAILQKDPHQREAAMLMATIYFENQKLKKALQLFDRGDSSLLINDTAFAWGATYLEFGDSKKALAGFNYLLKNKGPFRPLAIYYSGIAYFKLGQWSRARRYLQKVKSEDLPEALRVNRRRYLNEIKEQQSKVLALIMGDSEKQGQNQKRLQITDDFGSQTTQVTAKDELTDNSKVDSKGMQRIENQKGWFAGVKPSLALAQQSSFLDNHGLTHDAKSLYVHRAELSGNIDYADQKKGAVGFVGGLEYRFGSIGYTARLDQTQYFSLEQTSGVFVSRQSKDQSENSGFVLVHPRLNLFLTPAFRLDFGTGLISYLPKYGTEQRWGQTFQLLGMRYESDDTELGFEFGIQQPFDLEQNKTAQDQTVRADIEQQLGDFRINFESHAWQTDQIGLISKDRFRQVLTDQQIRFRMGYKSEVGASSKLIFNFFDSSLDLRLEAYQRALEGENRIRRASGTENIDTAATAAQKSQLTLTLPLWDSASIVGSAAYNQYKKYNFAVLNEDGTILQDYLTDVKQVVFQGGGTISFADWIRLVGTYAVSDNTYLEQSSKDEEFRRRNPDNVVDSTIYMEIGKTF